MYLGRAGILSQLICPNSVAAVPLQITFPEHSLVPLQITFSEPSLYV